MISRHNFIKAAVTLIATATCFMLALTGCSEYHNPDFYEGVQLWDGGPWWADRNIGAATPQDEGDLYAWGEISPKTSFGWSSYSPVNGSDNLMDNKSDAAFRNMGEKWRIPSGKDIMDLKERCTWEYVTVNDQEGYRITGPNGNSIFIPAAGYCTGSRYRDRNVFGHYWTADLDTTRTHLAMELYFNPNYTGLSPRGRDNGLHIRAVSDRWTPIQASVSQENSFTGRGNRAETLLNVDIASGNIFTLDEVTADIAAEPGDVSTVCLMDGDKVLGQLPFDGPRTYTFKCGGEIKGKASLKIAADITEEAVEGNKVSASVISITADGIQIGDIDNTPANREILLRRKCLYAPGDYGSNYWRIPGILQLCDGTLLTVNDRRNVTEEDLPERIDVVYSYSTDGGKTWSQPGYIAKNTGVMNGYGDPALVECEDGTVICLFTSGEMYTRSSLENPQRGFISKSTDHGRTWTTPEEVTSLLWGPDALNPACRNYHSSFFSSGHGLTIKKGPYKGRVMVAHALVSKETELFCNHVFYSDDNGQTWNVSDLAFGGNGRSGDEAKLVELSDGRILMSIRQWGERTYVISEDGGQTWGEPATWKDMVVAQCNGEVIRYNDTILLHTAPHSYNRENVSIFVSYDDGKTWPIVKSFCHGPGQYSSLDVLDDGTIGVYLEEKTWGTELWYLNFSMDWVLDR